MNSTPEVRATVTSNVDVLIKATKPDINLDEPLYAINWFSTKVEWIYHLYNALAVRSVRNIGGRAFFKAKVKETILDEAKGRRDLILIIRYPGGQNFKSLMESTYFKIVSIFRVMSVSSFTFGFTHKIEAETKSTKEDGLYYAIHHFKLNKEVDTFLIGLKALLPDSISIKYTGNMVATLNKQEKGKDVEQIPNLMDALVIFQSSDEEALRSLFAKEEYKELRKELQSSHISLLERISV